MSGLCDKLRYRAETLKSGARTKREESLAALMIEAADKIAMMSRKLGAFERKAICERIDPAVSAIINACREGARSIYRLPGGTYRTVAVGKDGAPDWQYVGDAQCGAKRAEIEALISGAVRVPIVEGHIPHDGRIGSIVPLQNTFDMAVRIADCLDAEPRDVFRLASGAVRIVRAGVVINGEFLGRFDEGADIQAIVEALE